MYIYVYIYIYGWLSIFLLPGTANATKIMVPPYDEREDGGLEYGFGKSREE